MGPRYTLESPYSKHIALRFSFPTVAPRLSTKCSRLGKIKTSTNQAPIRSSLLWGVNQRYVCTIRSLRAGSSDHTHSVPVVPRMSMANAGNSPTSGFGIAEGSGIENLDPHT